MGLLGSSVYSLVRLGIVTFLPLSINFLILCKERQLLGDLSFCYAALIIDKKKRTFQNVLKTVMSKSGLCLCWRNGRYCNGRYCIVTFIFISASGAQMMDHRRV